MAAKNWSDGQVALIERLEEMLFRDEVAEITVGGDHAVRAHDRAGHAVTFEPELVVPDAMLRDLTNELLLPYAERKPQPRGSKSGNPAKRAAENRALGLTEAQPTRVKGTTGELAATLQLPHSTDKSRSLRVQLQTSWPPVTPTGTLKFAKLG